MSNCTSTYVVAFVVFIIAAVLFHFYVVAPFLIGLFREQQVGELLAVIQKDPKQKSRLKSPFPTSNDSVIAESAKTKSGELVKPLESVLSFFENRKKAVTTS